MLAWVSMKSASAVGRKGTGRLFLETSSLVEGVAGKGRDFVASSNFASSVTAGIIQCPFLHLPLHFL